MVKKKEKETNSIKVGIVFTSKQVELIDKLISETALGGNRSDVIRNIVMFYLKDRENANMSGLRNF